MGLVGDDGFVGSVATWTWVLLSWWWRAFYFYLSSLSKFRRENCIIVRQMNVVVLDAWWQLVSDVDTVDSTESWTWTAPSLRWRTFFVSLGDVLVRGGSWGCRIAVGHVEFQR